VAIAPCRGASHTPDPVACPSQTTPTACSVYTASTRSALPTPTIEGFRHGKTDSWHPSVALPAISSPAQPKRSMWPALRTHRGNIGLGGAQLSQGPVETCFCTPSPRLSQRLSPTIIAKALTSASQLGWHHFLAPAIILPLRPIEIAPGTSGDSRVQSAITRRAYSPHAYPPP
jgi:hypothetical protein